MLFATVALASILAGLWLLRELFLLWMKPPTEYRPPLSPLAALLAQLQRIATVARRFVLAPRYAALLVMATWATFLLAPGTAHASGFGDVVLGSSGGYVGLAVSAALFLASTFHIADKIAAWVKSAKAPVVSIPGHPALTEGLAALENAALHVLQDIVTPDLLNTLEDMLKTKSFAEIGAWLTANYGPKILADVQAQGQSLLGAELALVFGGQAAVIQAATLRLGVASSKVVATNKVLLTAPSGRTIVASAP